MTFLVTRDLTSLFPRVDRESARVHQLDSRQRKAVEDDSVKRCPELAAEKNWKDALGPCTEAAEEKPDDLSIKHALQQAQAAAKG